MKTIRSIKHIALLVLLLVVANRCGAQGATGYIPDFGNYEIYSTGASAPPPRIEKESIFSLTPKNALNLNGLGGLIVANTADRLEKRSLIVSSRYRYHKLTSTKGTSFYNSESGSVGTFETSLNWIGDFAEWAITVPMHSWSLDAPRTLKQYSSEDLGLGNLKFGLKATYLPDKSYYRFAYGAIATVNTGHPEKMVPAGARNSDELTLFGCVTTKETDRATANIDLGATIDSEGREDRFHYRLGLTYEATEHVSLIGELAGEVQGGNDKDTLDMIMGIRFAATRTFILEFAYHKNMRTYREYGWDDQLQAGVTLNW